MGLGILMWWCLLVVRLRMWRWGRLFLCLWMMRWLVKVLMFLCLIVGLCGRIFV